ncbi:MAG: DUF2299 domain-containing protein [Methanotrichaceae archaeon]
MRKIRDWLTEQGIFRSQVSDEKAFSHIQIEFPAGSGRSTGIVFPKPREDIVLIIGGVSLSKEHYDKLKAMPDEERKDLLWDMQFDLLFKESEFQMIPNAEDLQQIQFIRPLRLEGLTRNLMMDAIRDNYRCVLYVIWTMARHFGAAPPKSQDAMYS